MAQPSMSVTSALPVVGLCAVTLPADGPTINILKMPHNGHIVAYDKHTWSRTQIEELMQLHFGDYELVQAAPEDGA